jgi:hypothetical protein
VGSKRRRPRDAGPALAQMREIKAFYGIHSQRLEGLLLADGRLSDLRILASPAASRCEP